jgi:thioredoxin reductase (NADPH)
MSNVYDVAIVGGGPAGMTAAIYTGRAMLKTVIIEKAVAGGLMALTDKLENVPGFDSIGGGDLAELMLKQATKFGAGLMMAEVAKVEKKGDRFILRTDTADVEARTVIWAAGSSPRKVGVPGEMEYIGRGVSYCAVCDAAFYRGLRVAVIGGGDSSLKEALYLTRFASEVAIIHRRNEFRAEKIIQDEVRKHPKIKLILESVVEKIEGKDFVESVTVKNVKSGALSEHPVDGVFIFVGYTPHVEAVKDLVTLSPTGRIQLLPDGTTGTPGLFAAGDVVEKLVYQVATAIGCGASSATAVEHYLSTHK